MAKYLDPKSDIVFKKIFCAHPELLKSFLNGLLPLPADGQIQSLEYLHPEQVPQIPEFKRTIVDVKCTDQQGRIFVVEMQISWTSGFMQRLLYGSAQAYTKQLKAGESYDKLNPVYGLGILGENFEPNSQEWYHNYILSNAQIPGKIMQDLSLTFIELPKVPIASPDAKKMRRLWLKFLREVGQSTEVDTELLAEHDISTAVRLAEESAYTPQELDLNEAFWKTVSSEKTLMFEREAKGRAEGRAEGLAEGWEKGMKTGIEKGIEKGLAEGIKQQQITSALKLKVKGMPVNLIAEVTGLSLQEVESLD